MYKRNQISEALVEAIRSRHSRLDDNAILKRIKRLLDQDRKAGPSKYPDAAPYAFFDAEAVGSGRDIPFSRYSTFAVFIALRLMSCGLPQGRAVFMLRRFRPALEREHAMMTAIDITRFLEAETTVIGGSTAAGKQALLARGHVVQSLKDMVFFCIHADLEAVGLFTRTIADADGPRPDNICRGKVELERRIGLDAHSCSPTLVIEMMNPCIQLNHLLSQTRPVRRGRRRGT